MLKRTRASKVVAAAVAGGSLVAFGSPPAMAAHHAGAALANNGRWSGLTAQGLQILLRVRNHRVVSVSGTVRLRPLAGFTAGACTQPRRFRATLTSSGSAPGTSTRKRFWLWVARDPFAQVTGQVVDQRTIKGKLTFESEGSPDPCFATVKYSAHPS